ncbi:MAG TPA: hypothetical protein VM537_32495 [Anaerolineae bacterium]|nr:hypothetical protein [Anaerolineae bacterium]
MPTRCPICGSKLVQPRLFDGGWDCLACGARSVGAEAITRRRDHHRQLEPVELVRRKE